MTHQFDLPELVAAADLTKQRPPFVRDAHGFTIKAHKLSIGKSDYSNAEFYFQYDERFSISLEFLAPEASNNFFKDDLEYFLTVTEDSAPVEIFATNRTINSSGEVSFIFTPRQEPFTLFSVGDIERVVATIINGPNFYFNRFSRDLTFGNIKVSLRDFEDTYEMRKMTKLLRRRALPTGLVEFTSLNDRFVDSGEIDRLSNFLRVAFWFMRGAASGIGHVRGYRQSALVYARPGFFRIDDFQQPSNWFGIEEISIIPEFLNLLWTAMKEETDKAAILRAIEFYRASTVIRGSSIEIAIVSSQTALEVLVNHILQARGGWNGDLLGQRTPFHAKVRACCAFVGLTSDLMEHSPYLKAWAKRKSSIDAFEVITRFRNGLVHGDADFSYSGIEIVECWEMQQWLVEVLLFYLIGYRHKMNDRRRLTGWKGPSVQVPLK